MKYVAGFMVLVTLAGCSKNGESPVSGGSAAPAAPEKIPPANVAANAYRILGPFTSENLSVFLIQKDGARREDGECITLDDGLKSGVVKVSEKSEGAEVNRLQIENTGDKPVYIQAGDTVKGGQQDRTIAVDFLLPPKSGKTAVDAFCVEPGRWSLRHDGATTLAVTGVSGAYFELSEAPLATKEQKLAAKLSQSQAEVWEAGRGANAQLARNAKSARVADSFVLAAEDPEVKKKTADTIGALLKTPEGKENLVGMAYAVNGETSTIDIYVTSGLFLKLWPKLLRTAALEALAKKTEKPASKSAAAADIAAVLEAAGKNPGVMENRTADLRVKVYDGKETALFDTERGGELLHRQVIKK